MNRGWQINERSLYVGLQLRGGGGGGEGRGWGHAGLYFKMIYNSFRQHKLCLCLFELLQTFGIQFCFAVAE